MDYRLDPDDQPENMVWFVGLVLVYWALSISLSAPHYLSI